MELRKKLKILFLLKENQSSGGYSSNGKRSGLYNSANILAYVLANKLGASTAVENVVDGNSVDKQLVSYKPDICIIEALWVTPAKIAELAILHPKVLFVIRIHSEIPFLSNEGIAIEWIKDYLKINKVVVGLNSKDTFVTFKQILKDTKRLVYLPNVYSALPSYSYSGRKYIKEFVKYMLHKNYYHDFDKDEIDIGCFGAIRPIKNQLIQAVAAMSFAEDHNVKLNFHINASRTEQGGDSILKNIRALFKDSSHNLVEHEWLERKDFLYLVSQMDAGLQVSFNESFNIVAADFVSQGIPIVVSKAIKWMPDELKTETTSVIEIVSKLEEAFVFNFLFKILQYQSLADYNGRALTVWDKFLK